MPTLFDPLTAGALKLKNRIIMAPLTRGRADDRTPNRLEAEYYAQRASAGLIVSEATAISAEGYGWAGAPAMYTDEHEQGWKLTTDAVHRAGGLIVLQLWHMGRLSHPDYLNGELPLSASAIAAPGQTRDASGSRDYVVPRAMTIDDIKRTVADYAACAKRAIRAGFDGVEIHGANGYLIDQFLRDGTNTRTDEYGGPVENRTRFLLEVVDAVIAEIGAERTGLRLSPVDNGTANGPPESDMMGLFTHAAKELGKRNLAFLHVREIWKKEGESHPPAVTIAMRKFYPHPLFANDMYDFDSGTKALENNTADAVVYGRAFIANPDLVERFRAQAELNKPDSKTFYTPGPHGYTDYPFLK